MKQYEVGDLVYVYRGLLNTFVLLPVLQILKSEQDKEHQTQTLVFEFRGEELVVKDYYVLPYNYASRFLTKQLETIMALRDMVDNLQNSSWNDYTDGQRENAWFENECIATDAFNLIEDSTDMMHIINEETEDSQ